MSLRTWVQEFSLRRQIDLVWRVACAATPELPPRYKEAFRTESRFYFLIDRDLSESALRRISEATLYSAWERECIGEWFLILSFHASRKSLYHEA